jgi:TRAP-type uncharacterized transport system substrate-binding protein
LTRRLSELSWRDILLIGLPAIAIAVGGFWLAAKFIKPAPPTRIVMATGVEGGGYAEFGARYRAILARSGITLDLKPTRGSEDNYNLLRDPNSGVAVALIQSGVGTAEEAPNLMTLGSVAYEPLWVFCRGNERLERIPQLKGRRLAIGLPGSGTRLLAMGMLLANGLDEESVAGVHVSGIDGANALLLGAVDCMFVIAAPEAGIVKALTYAPGLTLMSFDRAEAYVRRLPYLTRLLLPEGVIDMQRSIPPRDVQMVAATAELVARDDLHPAIQMLLLMAATEIHGGSGLFHRAGDFPSDRQFGFPVSSDARRFFRSGRPFLQRYLPFWLANLMDRMLVAIIPLVAVLFPLFRIVPPLYRWRVRSRIYRWYGELMFIENEIRTRHTPGEIKSYRDRLETIERTVNGIEPPLAYADQLYALRLHIEFVRAKLGNATSAAE